MAALHTTIPQVTMEQLQWLAQGERYGTQSAAIQAAVQDLFGKMQGQGQEAKMDTQAMAETIYTEIYGDIDDRFFRANKTQAIQDWLDDGSPDEDATIEELTREWRNYGGDDEIVSLVGAQDWADVELTFRGMDSAELLAELNRMYPAEDNEELADRIHGALD
jgi:Arc/MetJ-type ribon-helix-helix transcriptional regulator